MNKTLKTIFVLLLIFVSGIVFGVGGTLIIEKAMIKRFLENPGKARMILVNRISKQCNLSSEQQDSIKTILDNQAREFAVLRHGIAPEIERVLDDTHGNILDELDESQKAKFEKHYSIMMEKFRKTYYSYKLDNQDYHSDLNEIEKETELADSTESGEPENPE